MKDDGGRLPSCSSKLAVIVFEVSSGTSYDMPALMLKTTGFGGHTPRGRAESEWPDWLAISRQKRAQDCRIISVKRVWAN
jgi:hypothetical protein